MEVTAGHPAVRVAIIDGPVSSRLGASETALPNRLPPGCTNESSPACAHGTFVARMLSAARNSDFPGICPGCQFLSFPVFPESSADGGPRASADQLAAAIRAAVTAGAAVLNLSLELALAHTRRLERLTEALHFAAARGVLVVLAAGNQGLIGSSALAHHPWVLAVVACDAAGMPVHGSNLGASIGRRGLSAPGDRIRGLGSDGRVTTMSGSSVAVPFVSGTVALLCSVFPQTSRSAILLAITDPSRRRQTTLIPPMLNAWAAYQALKQRRFPA
jgi:subtilisin family serine protease